MRSFGRIACKEWKKKKKQTVQVRQKKNNVCESFLHTSFTTLNHVCIWKSCSLLLPAQMNNRPPFNPVCTHLCYTKRAQIEKRNMKQKQKAEKISTTCFYSRSNQSDARAQYIKPTHAYIEISICTMWC